MDNRILVLAGAFLGVSFGMFFLLISYVKQVFRSKQKLFIYILLFMLGFSLSALIGIRDVIAEPSVLLIFFQLLFLILGVIHAFAMYRHFSWDARQYLYPELFFTCLVWFTGMIPFMFIYKALRDDAFLYLAMATSLFFIVPFLFLKTYEAALDIPFRNMKEWFYPVQSPPEEPEEALLQKPLVIAFLMPKAIEDRKYTNFRAKAPSGMITGDLFYHFVQDYNAKNAGQTIEYADKYGRAYGWLFYFKPRWYLLYQKYYIDPDISIAENRIRENSVIVCERTHVPEIAEPGVKLLRDYRDESGRGLLSTR
jgi:hypothetical protein